MIGVRVEGMEQLRQQLGKLLPNEAHAAARRAVTKLAAKLRAEIKRSAPVDTGVLMGAVRSRRERGERDVAVASVYITKGKAAKLDAWYWHFIEFGTVTQAARPFITPALVRLRATLGRELGEEIIRQVARQLRKKAKAGAS